MFIIRDFSGITVTMNVGFVLFMYDIQQCFICRPSDSTVSEDAEIEPTTVATTALTVRRSNHSASLILNVAYRIRLVKRLYFWEQWFKRTSAWVVFLLTMHPVKFKNGKNGNSKVCWFLAKHLKIWQYFMIFRLEPYSSNSVIREIANIFKATSFLVIPLELLPSTELDEAKLIHTVVGRGHTSKHTEIFGSAWKVAFYTAGHLCWLRQVFSDRFSNFQVFSLAWPDYFLA